MNELALFAGAGGGILGGKLLGWQTVCAVEYDEYARNVLCARQDDGSLPAFPIWDDVRTFDGKPWRGLVDIITGGFPCQDISACGKGKGLEGERSGLWREMARIVGEIRPDFVLVENSPMLVGRGLAVVLGDLSALGYDARWGVVGAWHCGAPHKRDRIWILAYASGRRLERWPDSESRLAPKLVGAAWLRESPIEAAQRILGMGNGVAGRMGGLKAVGNGQVPAALALAVSTLSEKPETVTTKHNREVS
jgi:DNA (cytosine-5)-methyltransferase 1